MNCPFHNLIYKSRGRSYRELPLRLFEFGSVYRYEKSGVIHGLTRVRGMTQDDAHIYCTPDQMGGEFAYIGTIAMGSTESIDLVGAGENVLPAADAVLPLDLDPGHGTPLR
jgi:threonyl-tRNA synthetase